MPPLKSINLKPAMCKQAGDGCACKFVQMFWINILLNIWVATTDEELLKKANHHQLKDDASGVLRRLGLKYAQAHERKECRRKYHCLWLLNQMYN